jgi:serine/threonine protein kinase
MQLAPGTILAGKYRLEHPLATGGMGSIWAGRHLQLDVPVAMKFMEGGNASGAGHARFEREARWVAALRNQHVVQVLDYGVEDGVPYLVMELLIGEDLGERLSRERRISLASAAKILAQTARGLRTAHEARVVHRDLKPANIFLARVDDEEVVKILDFGIAKEAVLPTLNESTKTGELMGSPHYMSPEQVRGARDLDARSDLWSLAVILFRALTGKLPFPGDAIGAVIAQVLADPIPMASLVAPDLPPQLDVFFARGFARDRAQRFQTAREMAEAFAAIVNLPGEDFGASRAGMPTEPFISEDLLPRPRFPSNHGSMGGARERPSTTLGDTGFPTGPTPAPATEPSGSSPSLGPNTPPSFTPGSIGSPTLGGGGTGGPVTHTRRPADRTPPAWWGFATGVGTVLGVLCGAALFVVSRPAPSPDADPPPAPAATVEVPFPEATVDPPDAPPAPTSSALAPASSASSAPPASSASSSPPPKPSPAPKHTTPAHPTPKKKP